MAEFVNSLTGTRMWVAPEREAEYRLAGHRPVDDSGAGAKPTPAPARKAPRAAAKTRTTPKK